MTEKKEAALAKIEEYAIVAMGDSIADIMAENLGDDGLSEFSLDRIRIPAGGGIAFEVPTLEGSDSAKTIEGVVETKMSEGQLDDVDFTLKDLALIKQTLLTAFQSMYHTRKVKELKDNSQDVSITETREDDGVEASIASRQ